MSKANEPDHDHDGHRERVGFVESIRHLLAPHSHDHVDSVDSALEASEEGMRALKISLAGLAVTAVLQSVRLRRLRVGGPVG